MSRTAASRLAPRPLLVRRTGWIVVLLLLAGAAVTGQRYLAEKRRVGAAAVVERTTRAAELQAEAAELKREQARLQQEKSAQAALAAREAATAPLSPDQRLAAFQFMAGLRGRGGLVVFAPVTTMPASIAARLGRGQAAPAVRLNQAGRMPDGFAEVFGVPPTRFAQLQQAIAGIKREMDELVLASTTLPSAATGTIVLEVRLGQREEELRARLRTALTEAAGASLFAAYETLVPTSFGTLWRDFGGDDRTITVSRVQTAQRVSYQIATRYVASDLGGGTSSTGADWGRVVTELGVLRKFLPADF